jgi:hypothetical protein
LSEVEKLATTLKDFYFFNILVVKHQHHVGIEMIRQIDSAEGPKFIYKHFMAAHSGVKSYKKKFMNRLAAFRAGYPQKIRKVNEILLLEVRRILDRDPSAIIVIVADHGTWGGAERTLAGFTEDEILDKFNVFLAIKWGDAYRGQYDASIKTSVNLFRFIFAFLDQDDRILETKVEDESYLSLNGIWKVVEEGDILSEPKALGSRPKLSQ